MQHFVNGALGYNLLPCYQLVAEEKANCHPEFTVSDQGDQSKCELQKMLDHTVKRILDTYEVQTAIAPLKKPDELLKLNFNFKEGLDGMGTLTQFQQGGKMLGNDSQVVASMFSALNLTAKNEDGSPEVLYTNEYANQACGQRPLRISYEKEQESKFDNHSYFIDFSCLVECW